MDDEPEGPSTSKQTSGKQPFSDDPPVSVCVVVGRQEERHYNYNAYEAWFYRKWVALFIVERVPHWSN
jgi:hypothetical protein